MWNILCQTRHYIIYFRAPVWVFSDEIDGGTIAVDKAKIFEIKPPIWPRRFFRNHRLTSKCCSVNHLVIIECLFSSKISLASLNNHFVSLPRWKCFKHTSNATRQNNFWCTSDDFVEKLTIWWKKRDEIGVRRYQYRGSFSLTWNHCRS